MRGLNLEPLIFDNREGDWDEDRDKEAEKA
jgi:hypothetical protein